MQFWKSNSAEGSLLPIEMLGDFIQKLLTKAILFYIMIFTLCIDIYVFQKS